MTRTCGCGCADMPRSRSCWPAILRAATSRLPWRSACEHAARNQAALVAISPLLQLAMRSKKAHPNIKSDAMFPARAFDALVAIVAGAAARNETAGRREEIYEPLEHIAPGLPPTLIHVSGAEALLHDARLAAGKLAAAGVRAEVRVWPGQLHDFQVAAPMLPEATYSLRQIGEYIRQATG